MNKKPGVLLLAEGWENTGKTSSLKFFSKIGMGDYFKTDQSGFQGPNPKSCTESVVDDLVSGALYSKMKEKLDRGENILCDRLWPSALVYGSHRGENPEILHNLAMAAEDMFAENLLYLYFVKDAAYEQPDEKIDVEARHSITSKYTGFFKMSRQYYMQIDTSPWHKMETAYDKRLFMINLAGVISSSIIFKRNSNA